LVSGNTKVLRAENATYYMSYNRAYLLVKFAASGKTSSRTTSKVQSLGPIVLARGVATIYNYKDVLAKKESGSRDRCLLSHLL